MGTVRYVPRKYTLITFLRMSDVDFSAMFLEGTEKRTLSLAKTKFNRAQRL